MKKIFTILIILILTLTFIGCTPSAESLAKKSVEAIKSGNLEKAEEYEQKARELEISVEYYKELSKIMFSK